MGADYNLLLISRLREESPHGIRSGVIRTVSSTGGVITAAGVIFAASMFGMLFASISTLVQAGFIIGTGLLLDTFLVRTITVPAIAVLVGKANWWPSRLPPPEPRSREVRLPARNPIDAGSAERHRGGSGCAAQKDPGRSRSRHRSRHRRAPLVSWRLGSWPKGTTHSPTRRVRVGVRP